MSRRQRLWNIPNVLTSARILLGTVLFIMMSLDSNGTLGQNPIWARDLYVLVYFFAAVSDTLDGQLARRWNMTTDFGRIADPFADKTLIIGIFIMLIPFGVGVQAWMVVLILARELLVSGLRSYIEGKGIAFGASVWGKWKMVIQAFTVGFAFLYLGRLGAYGWMRSVWIASLWLTVGVTTLSGVQYLIAAVRILSRHATEPETAVIGADDGPPDDASP